MRPLTLLWFYARRLRVHWMQELLAGVGIAVGVALLFSVQVANSSITASAREMLHAITGTATLQLAARDPNGLDARMIDRVERLPGVMHVAPMLEQRAALMHSGHRVPVSIIGIDARLKALNGAATSSLLLGGVALEHGLLIPAGVAHELGVPSNAPDGRYNTTVSVKGRASRIAVSAVFGERTIGVLSNASIAVMYLPFAQRLVGLPGRVTRILVVPSPGREALVRRELTTLAAGRLTVASVNTETRALEQATAPNDQATGLFAGVTALVGLLFTFNAMLLTMPERRAAVAQLRIEGYRPVHIALIVGFQTFVLGAVASGVGLLAGDLLSRAAAGNPPAYLAFAFPLGTHRVVPLSAIVLAWTGGVLATCLAGAGPLIDARGAYSAYRTLQERSEPGNALSTRTRGWLALAGIGLAASTSILVLIVPSLALAALLGLAVATVLIIPVAFTLALLLVDLAAQRWRHNAVVLAVRAVRATPLRSLALAATGAVAVFGSVAIEGAHRDLLRGLDRNFGDYLSSADLWVTVPGDENGLTTEGFTVGRTAERVRALPAVASARLLYSGLLDSRDRRIWVTGRPAEDRAVIPPSQLHAGDLNTANALLRRGGWAAVSESLVHEQHTHTGGSISISTPAGPRSYRVAATLTNLGWGPGAIILNARDYRHGWPSASPSAIEIVLKPRSDPALARRAVQAALPPGVALTVQTATERHAQFNRLADQGLTRLSQISALLLIAAAFAMAAAMGAAIWQRRVALARMRIDGYTPAKVWRTLLLETAIVLGVGCLTGGLSGIYGHLLGAHWLELSTGFPAPTVIGPVQPLATALLVAAVALAVTALPGYLAARTSPQAGLQE